MFKTKSTSWIYVVSERKECVTKQTSRATMRFKDSERVIRWLHPMHNESRSRRGRRKVWKSGGGALSNVVGIGLTDLPKSGLHVPSLAPTALRQVNDPRKNSSPEYSPLENCWFFPLGERSIINILPFLMLGIFLYPNEHWKILLNSVRLKPQTFSTMCHWFFNLQGSSVY